MFLSPAQTLAPNETARRELVLRRAPDSGSIFSASWSEGLEVPSRSLNSSSEQVTQEFEVAGSLTEVSFSVSLRESANKYLVTTGEALDAPVLSPAERLLEAARYVDAKLARDVGKYSEYSTAA